MKRLMPLIAILLFFCQSVSAHLPAQPRPWPEERFPLPPEGTNIIVNYCPGSQQAMTDSGCRKECYLPGHACYHNYQSGCWECHDTGELKIAKISGYCDINAGPYYSKQGCLADCLDGNQVCYFNYANNCWEKRAREEIDIGLDCLDPANIEECKYYYPLETEDINDFKVKLKQFYGQGINELPDLARGLIGNDLVNVVVDQELGLYIITHDSVVTEVGVGHLEEATLTLRLEEETVEKTLNREKKFINTLKTRETYFEGVGIFNTIKLILINFIMLLF